MLTKSDIVEIIRPTPVPVKPKVHRLSFEFKTQSSMMDFFHWIAEGNHQFSKCGVINLTMLSTPLTDHVEEYVVKRKESSCE